MSDKKTIAREDYYKLIGLLTIAKEHNAALRVIERAVAGIVGSAAEGYGYFGHASDAVGSDYTADELLSRMELGVES